MALIDHLNELSDGAKLLAQFEVGEAHKQNLWKKMVEFANTNIHVENLFMQNEAELLHVQEKNGVQIRDSKGKIIVSKMFDSKAAYSTYRSTKATILGAIKHGISLTNEDGSIKAKTALAKELKACTRVRKSSWEKAIELSGELKRTLPYLTTTEAATLHNYLFGGHASDETKT